MIRQSLIIILSTTLFNACTPGPDSPRGFSLPEGSAERGEQVFIKYQCLACHKLDGYDDSQYDSSLERKVRLGGNTDRVKTYAELLTSVINPSHKIARGYRKDSILDESGQSLMRNYNDVMTVSELVDLVAFLQPKYELQPFKRTPYPTYLP
ncbi:hypothetical protein HMF8227_02698 [Saliniradius amylolyticus]|uniref:Cytochrome c domain-containing protein n=1 Tax=Saliniradius amylolyticus TaxID=2183582 RepID=A0A2S2E6C1_9ALTE|nr:c-type cytochrome [Saliniradius amylolyticus]AWL13149.1 hypothetical protein HMF8227_02698 [Saliniradius amylolyticus]